MGFDNECILSIQSLPGEYFCPVCRLLVYPNEALQSQCTHLFCKPCLTYVVSTTKACPYDGYLVTEEDSKPLIESNKPLGEAIGKIGVHCLYHRSGCSWLGSLSECVSHCFGCAYGNSPVVCNRCAIQIVHRQVQEHAQSCPGVPAQAQADIGAATSASADQTQAATQNSATVSSSQPQAVAQAAVPNAEQWYQQQQNQYQQYQQHDYPNQQQSVAVANQPQNQAQQVHPGVAAQAYPLQPQQQHPGYDQYQQQYQQQYYPNQQLSATVASNLQAPAANQPQNQAQQVHPGVAPQTYPLHPQQQPYTQYPQPQIQTQVRPYPQTNKDPNAVTGHPSYPQSHVRSQPQVRPGPQSQYPIQQPTQMGPQHSHANVPSQQQQALLFPPPGQVQNIPPAQHLVKQPYVQQSGQAVHQRPVMQATFPQQLPTTQTHLRLQGQSHVYPQPPQSVVAYSPNPVGRPSVTGHGVQSQPYSQYAGGVSRPVYPGAYQQSTSQILKSCNQLPMPSEQQSSIDAKPTMSVSVANTHAEIESEKSSVDVKPVSSETKVTDEGRADQTGSKETNHSIEMQGGPKEEPIIMKEGNSEGALSHLSNGESGKMITSDIKDVLNHATPSVEDKKTVYGSDKVLQGISIASAQFNGGFMEPPRHVVDQATHQPLSSHSTLPQRQVTPPLGLPHQTPSQYHFGPQGPGAFGQPSSGVFPARATPLGPDMKGTSGFDSSSPMLSRDERLLFQVERFNHSFPAGPNRHMPDRAEFLEDMKRFPRPFDRGPHELKMESMALSSRLLPPYEGVRGRLEDPFGRMEPSRGDPDFFGAGPSFGREHRDMFFRGYRGPGPDEIRGREVHRFDEPFGGPLPESRFSMLPSHMRRGEFDGPGSMGMRDRLRNDFLGHDRFSSHLHNFHSREPLGFEAHSRHTGMREIGGSGMDLFGRGDRPNHPLLGEPGFRSSFSHRGFPNDGGIITGELSFDISKKRKLPIVGWCRICKVDCETVEGLDLHSQTREHQKTTMDIVLSIKQNAKRKKLTSGEQSLPGDESKSRNSGGEDHGKEN